MLSSEAAFRKDKTNAAARNVMQHRHFAVVAAILADMHKDGTTSREDARAVAEHFAWHLAATNDKFDKARFLAACEV